VQERATDQEIIDLYSKLKDGNKVGRMLHVNIATVYNVLRTHGVAASGRSEYLERVRKIGPEEKERVLRDYASGMSAAQIARNMDCTTEIVLRALRDSDIEIRSAKPPMTVSEKLEAKRLYESGMTFKEVAEATGRHLNTLIRVMNAEFPEVVRSDMVGPGSPHFRGGIVTDSQGYKQEWISAEDPFFCMARKGRRAGAKHSYVPQHRVVMARKLGRPLLESETVHHKDGDKTNNAPENLQLRQGKHGKHVVMCCLDCGSRNIGHAEI
jgi:transposase-like protein